MEIIFQTVGIVPYVADDVRILRQGLPPAMKAGPCSRMLHGILNNPHVKPGHRKSRSPPQDIHSRQYCPQIPCLIFPFQIHLLQNLPAPVPSGRLNLVGKSQERHDSAPVSHVFFG